MNKKELKNRFEIKCEIMPPHYMRKIVLCRDKITNFGYITRKLSENRYMEPVYLPQTKYILEQYERRLEINRKCCKEYRKNNKEKLKERRREKYNLTLQK